MFGDVAEFVRFSVSYQFDVGTVDLLNFRREIGDGNFEDQKAVGIGIAVLFVNEDGIVHEEENGAIGREVGPGGIVLDRAFEGFEFAFESIKSALEFRRGIVCGAEGYRKNRNEGKRAEYDSLVHYISEGNRARYGEDSVLRF